MHFEISEVHMHFTGHILRDSNKNNINPALNQRYKLTMSKHSMSSDYLHNNCYFDAEKGW